MGLALCAYNEYYLNKPLTYFFNSPYADKMIDLVSGKYTEEYVHRQLSNRLSVLIEPGFLKGFRTDPNNVFAVLLKENNLNNFIIRTPTRFIHGTHDLVVPFPVAEKSFRDLIQLGTRPEILELQSFEGGHDHFMYLTLMMDWFATFNA